MVNSPSPFPNARMRRMRATPARRAMQRENCVTPADLIWPIFVQEGSDLATPVASMPGVSRLSIDNAVKAAQEARDLLIPAICLFPYIEQARKTEDCAEAWDADNLINRTIRAIKLAVPEIEIMTDVALDPYNINGHDG